MDPKKREEILRQVHRQVEILNLLALMHYARLLQRCGVQRARISQEIFLP